jgi:hypothetical protein
MNMWKHKVIKDKKQLEDIKLQTFIFSKRMGHLKSYPQAFELFKIIILVIYLELVQQLKALFHHSIYLASKEKWIHKWKSDSNKF